MTSCQWIEQLLATYPELRSHIEDGFIIHFEACITQIQQGDLKLLVEGLLGILRSKLNGYHVSLACITWSWACLSKRRYRALEGAALDYKAQVVEKQLALARHRIGCADAPLTWSPILPLARKLPVL